jgi:hypothetical protein
MTGLTNQSAPLDRDRWSLLSSVLVAIAFGGAAMFYSLSLYARTHSHLFHGHSVWFVPSDIWMPVDTGRYVWDGSLNHLYRVYQGFNSLPLSSIVMAPVAEVISRHNLIENVVPVAKPSAWLLVGPYTLAFNVFFLDAVRRLSWDLGVRHHLWRVQLAAALVVLVPCFEWSHFEDVLALTFVFHAFRYAFKQDFVRAALTLSIAVCWKQWAVLLVPLLVFSTPRTFRTRTLVAACALPALLMGFFLVMDSHDAARALLYPSVTPSRSGYTGFLSEAFGAQGTPYGRGSVVLIAIVIGWLFRRSTRPTVVLALLSVVLTLRPLTEPVNWSYYWTPGLCAAALTGIAAHRSVRMRDWVLPAGAIVWSLPHPGRPALGWWWSVEVALLLAVGVRVVRNCGRLLPVRTFGRAASVSTAQG